MVLQKLFGFNPMEHKVKTEIMAGLTTFLTMAYILAVNPSIFSALAGTENGMDTGAVFTATAIASIVGTLVMAFYAKLPFGLAPGMGLNAFFVFTVCLGMGYSWQFALTAILLEGILFILMTVTNIRTLIIKSIPYQMKAAISVGIGLFIAYIGLRNCGLIVANQSTVSGLGSLSEPTALLALIGIAITSLLLIFKVKGALLLGIIVTTLIGIPMGVTQMSGIVSTPPSVAPICLQFEWDKIFTADMLIVVLTFLFVDLFDTIGTFIGVMSSSGMAKKDGSMPRLKEGMLADAVATTVGACVGASTTTTYVESAAGVSEGGRTGLTAASIAVFFAISLFFSPLFLSIPSAATSPVLVLVGLMMFGNVKSLTFEDYGESIPCFITVIMMVLAGSISEGILMGVISYALLNALGMKWDRLNPTIIILAIIFTLKYIFM